VVGVAHEDDAGLEWNRLPGQAVGITLAVPALVAGANYLSNPAEHASDPVEHVLALDRVGLDDLELVVAEPCGLVENLLGYRDLADVVQHGRELQLLPGFGLDSHLVGDGIDQLHHRAAVVGRVGVTVLDHVREQHHCATVRPLKLQCRRVALPPVAREEHQQPDEWPDSQHGEGMLVSGQTDHQRDGGERRLDPCGSRELLSHLLQRDLVNQTVADDAPGEVE